LRSRLGSTELGSNFRVEKQKHRVEKLGAEKQKHRVEKHTVEKQKHRVEKHL
jgi:hypothetical protein